MNSSSMIPKGQKYAMENEIIFRSRFRTHIAPRAVFVALMGISLCVGILIPFGVQPLQVESWWTVLSLH